MLEGQLFEGAPIQFEGEGGLVRPPWYQRDAQYPIDKMGLGTSLIYTLDPGALASYDPDTDAQSVLDLSGNGNDFWVGAGSGSEATDPAYNGTKGALSKNEYFGLDGGDYLTIKSMPAALETFHKDGAVFTIAGWFYSVSGGGQHYVGSRASSSGSVGCSLLTGAGIEQIRLNTGASGMNVGLGTPTHNSWNFIAASLDEATGTLTWMFNDTSFSGGPFTYATPSASDVGTWVIGMNRVSGQPMLTGSRIGPQWAWSRALSLAEMEQLRAASRIRGWLS